jgi:hypothetical protein
MAETEERRVTRNADEAVKLYRRWQDENPKDSVPPLWIAFPPEDQIVVSQHPECDAAGNVARMGFYNASGERVR